MAHYKELCRFAITFLNSETDAEEVVQRFFVRLWEQRKQAAVPDNIRSFFFKSVYNECLNFIRNQKKRNDQLHDFSDFLALQSDNPAQELSPQIVKQLGEAINNLPAKCRQIFILNKMEGLTQREIADYMNIAPKTVENQMGIAIAKLRAELKPILHLLPAGFIFFQNF